MGLDKPFGNAKMTDISGDFPPIPKRWVQHPESMTPIPPPHFPEKRPSMEQCKHPRVQIVSREEDAEFVECLVCGEIFESSEFKDMTIEETKLREDS